MRFKNPSTWTYINVSNALFLHLFPQIFHAVHLYFFFSFIHTLSSTLLPTSPSLALSLSITYHVSFILYLSTPFCVPISLAILSLSLCEKSDTALYLPIAALRQVSCFSNQSLPFFRARMEAYLDGDGSHKGSSLSVFLRILPGEMDDQLPWPAHLKLSFILVNHSGK